MAQQKSLKIIRSKLGATNSHCPEDKRTKLDVLSEWDWWYTIFPPVNHNKTGQLWASLPSCMHKTSDVFLSVFLQVAALWLTVFLLFSFKSQCTGSAEGWADTKEKGEEPKVLMRSSSGSDQSEPSLLRRKSMYWTRRLSRRAMKRSDSIFSSQTKHGMSRLSERAELTELVRNRMQHLGLHTGFSKYLLKMPTTSNWFCFIKHFYK